MTYLSLLNQLNQVSSSESFADDLDMTLAQTGRDGILFSLQEDLNFIRTQLRQITGEANWYAAPDVSLATVSTDLGTIDGRLDNDDTYLGNVYTYTGMVDGNDSTPDYSSNYYVTDSTSLTAAISVLDAILHDVSGSANTVPTLQSVTDAGATTTNAITVGGLTVNGSIIVSGTVDGHDVDDFITAAKTFTGMTSDTDNSPDYSSNVYVNDGDSLTTAIGKLDAAITGVDIVKVGEAITSNINDGVVHQLPGGNSYTPDATYTGKNMDVYINGQLQTSDTVSGSYDRDYLEADSTRVIFHKKVSKNSLITYTIRK